MAAAVETTLEIKKSRFLGRVEPVTSAEEGLEVVAQLRRQHPDAAHVCYCLLINGEVRQSDDGEPSGTAALPMLNVLRHKELDMVLATVVRYFGGVKLGAGGLVRAYTQAIADALRDARLCAPVVLGQATLMLDFAHESLLRRLVESAGLELEITYGQRIVAELNGEATALQTILQQLQEASGGSIEVVESDCGSQQP
nr:YigZ family protein [Desulfurispira natronophila]